LTYYQIEFPKTHDVDKLLDFITTVNGTLSKSLRDVIVLTNYDVDIRYPGDFPEVTFEDTQEAIRLADKVRKLVLELI
jgi:HEPN domain-containing protein